MFVAPTTQRKHRVKNRSEFGQEVVRDHSYFFDKSIAHAASIFELQSHPSRSVTMLVFEPIIMDKIHGRAALLAAPFAGVALGRKAPKISFV